MLQLYVPDFALKKNNIFNIRQNEWGDSIVNNVQEMLNCCSKFGIRVTSITLTKPDKVDKSEIKKTISRFLNIDVVYNDKEIKLTYEIPWLVDNFFYISGNKKLSIFQLFDKPVITKNNIIMIRTNVQSFIVNKKMKRKNGYCYHIEHFGKNIPFVYYVHAYLGSDEIEKRYGVSKNGEINIDLSKYKTDVQNLIMDFVHLYKNDKFDSGTLLSQYYSRKTDKDVVNQILLVTDIDIFTKRYLVRDNIIEEFLHVILNGGSDYLDYGNKRLRFAEQVIYCHLCRDFYNMILSIKNTSNKRSSFHNNSKNIIQSATVSTIVQFDHSLNPLAELAFMTRTSLSGAGGFEKDNVPSDLRDINMSMQGIVCGADTGDRENCGSLQYLVPTVELTPALEFADQTKNNITSVSICHVPFLEHDDSTRLQMSSSQQRHAIMLQSFDLPIVQSGIEGMYTDKTSFMLKAEKDGQVVFRDNQIIIIKYINGECKAYNISYKKMYLTVCDFYKVYFKCGDKFKKGDIICESNFLSNGRLTLGRNLKTAVMIYHGYNYEDSIVISDALVKDNKLSSVHLSDLSFELTPKQILLNLNSDYSVYKPLPEIGEKISKGQVYAKLQTIRGAIDSEETLFDEPYEMTSTEDCIIVDIDIYANRWCDEFPQFKDYVSDFIKNKKEKKDKLISTLGQYLTDEQLDNFLETLEIDKTDKNKSMFKIKGETIEGIKIDITALYLRPISVGDKLGNRHGNKGVISRIIPEDQMPIFENGERAEIIINPLGVPSRMNIGQFYELSLSCSVKDLVKNINKNLDSGLWSYDDCKKYIIEYIKIIDCTKDNNYTNQMYTYLNNTSLEEFKKDLTSFYVIQPPFESITVDKLKLAMEYTNTKYHYLCYDPLTQNDEKIQNDFKYNIDNPIAFGYMYFMKLNHIAKDKHASRSIGNYSSKTCQPTDGKSRGGGQRLGEMEVWALIGHGADHNLKEFLCDKSDSLKLRNAYLSRMVQSDDKLLTDNEDSVSQAIRLFQTYLKTIGLNYNIKESTTET